MRFALLALLAIGCGSDALPLPAEPAHDAASARAPDPECPALGVACAADADCWPVRSGAVCDDGACCFPSYKWIKEHR